MSQASDHTIALAGRLENRDDWSAERCPIDSAISVLGARPTMLLLREAFYGAHCFTDFVARAGFTEAVTSARLKELLRIGVLEQRPYQAPGQRTRDAYYLTQKGRELFPVLIALASWGERWEQADEARSVTLVHEDCGAALAAQVRCAAGHEVDIAEAEARLG